MKVRRVVTGHDRDGKAVFASDEEVDPLTLALMPGAEFHRASGHLGPTPSVVNSTRTRVVTARMP